MGLVPSSGKQYHVGSFWIKKIVHYATARAVWNIRVALTSESLWQPLGLLLNPTIDFSPFRHRWEQEEKTDDP